MTTHVVQWSGKLAILVSLALALVLAWLLVQLLWLALVGPQVESAPVPAVPQIQPAAAGREGFRWDLFGESVSARPVTVAVPAARTELQLRGLMSGGDQAFAIIADARGHEQVFQIGDELPDGSRLSAIEPLQILLERDGRREALAIERELSGSPPVAGRSRASGRNGPDASSLPGIRGFQAPTGISAASLQVPGATAAGLADQISVLPVSSGGFRVRPGRDATLFAELGLQVNDVVTAVNGQPLTSREDAQALFADVLRRGEVSITINRQGREMTLRPDLAQILSRIQ
ncbi:MAG: type II secretion system protein N [Wenzhouxiangella sp.]|jgi:general secretion pathway protein C|nr:type II secretion system protein N [Wenzhouxiangella sp.]